MSEPRPLALEDVRVLDVAQLLPGPFTAQVLADLGADVIKVEPPGGDGARSIRGELFVGTNRNKRGLVVDLKTEPGREEFRRLAADADVVVEGYRPGVVERLGIGYDDVAGINPRIVYCSVSGYGRSGPDAQLPGHDINYLARSGAMSFSGHWGESPRRPGVPMADLGAASFAAIAILAALHERDRTGIGCHLDVSMTDVMTAWAAARGGPALDRDADDRRHLYPTNDVFRTRDDRWLALGAVEERFWQSARRVLASQEPRLREGRFDDPRARVDHADELHDLVMAAVAGRDLADWLEAFAETDAPVSAVDSLRDVVARDRNRSHGVVREADGQSHVVFPVRRDGAVMGRLRTPAPPLGAPVTQQPSGGEQVRWISG